MEKVYKTMRNAGIVNIILGVLIIVSGALCGGFIILSGAKLLARKDEIMF